MTFRDWVNYQLKHYDMYNSEDYINYNKVFMSYNNEVIEDFNNYNKVIKKIQICPICNKEVDAIGKEYCNECYSKFKICCSCHGHFPHILTHDNKNYCQNCFDNLYFICECCRYKKLKSDKKRTKDNKELCSTCYKKYYFVCENCSKEYSSSDKSHLVRNYCENCAPDSKVLNYQYKPLVLKFLGNKRDKIFMGVELEIGGAESNESLVNVIEKYTNYKDFYFKKDNSIPNYGFEIVTHPANLGYHKKIWKNLFEDLRFNSINQITNCGLHAHFSRSLFDLNDIAVLDCFCNNCDDLLEQYAGRSFNRYCLAVHKNLYNWGQNTTDRYSAVNLNNEKTIELRFCKSANNYDDFVKKIEFLHSIVKFILKSKLKPIDIIDNRRKIFNKYLKFANNNYNFIENQH